METLSTALATAPRDCLPAPTARRTPARSRHVREPGRSRLQDALGRMPLFAGLHAEQLSRLAKGCSIAAHRRGSTLCQHAEPGQGFHLIVAGQIKLAFGTTHGHQKVVEILRPGQSFGEAAMFMHAPCSLVAQALTDCELIFVPRDTLFAELENNPPLVRNLLTGLSRHLHHMVCELESHTLRSGRERIIGFLLREKDQCERPATNGPVMLQLSTKKETIASRLNMTKEHFSRLIHELAAEGLIEIQRRNILIPDVSRLNAALA